MIEAVLHFVFAPLVCVTVVAFLFVFYIVWVCCTAYSDTKETPKADFYTCDKHGIFPVKYLMELPLNDGGTPIKQCPFCYEEAFKKADVMLKAEDVRRGIQT